MKVFLIGCTGFIGSKLFQALQLQGDEITVVVRDKDAASHLEKSIKVLDFLDLKLIDGKIDAEIFYFLLGSLTPALAEQTANDSSTIEQDLLNFIMDKMKTESRLVFLSSGGTVYGELEGVLPHTETGLLRPTNKYGKYKLNLENLIQQKTIQSRMTAYIIRLSNPYGPWPKNRQPFGFINRCIEKCFHHESIEIFGSMDIVRDYIHIEDVVSALLCLRSFDLSGFHIFNVGTGKGHSLRQVIDILRAEVPVTVSLIENRSFDLQKNILDIRKIRETSLWFPKINLNQGVIQTLRWRTECFAKD